MSPVQTYQEEARERFLDFWLREEGHGEAIGCVATTYTFGPDFFEEHCLGRFVGMQTQPDEDGRVYLVEREEKLAQVSCIALVDPGHVPQSRSLRWHVLPVRVPDGGILHAKVTLLVWEWRVRVMVGSERVKMVLLSYGAAQETIRKAETELRPWVIQHRRPRMLPEAALPRRRRFNGAGIESEEEGATEGLGIRDQAVLPFLLAARSQAILMRMSTGEAERIAGRATFAEGLASSYEAFLETRRRSDDGDGEAVVDEDEEGGGVVEVAQGRDVALKWYLDRLNTDAPIGGVSCALPG